MAKLQKSRISTFPNAGSKCASSELGGFPLATIPLMPVLDYAVFGSEKSAQPSLLNVPHIFTSAGRAAITLALQDVGIGLGDEVLVPAYHCESMIAPVDYVGAKPVFYRVETTTLVNIEDIESKITTATRAILAAHYFGFPQCMSELRKLCDFYELVLIEDCAHTFFGMANDRPIGTVGDYAIGSVTKFFPVFDGGILVSSSRNLVAIEQSSASLAMEIKGLFSIVEYAVRYSRFRLISLPLRITIMTKNLLWNATKKIMKGHDFANLAPSSSQGGYSLDPGWIKVRMSRISEFILSHSRIDKICEGRLINYHRIVELLEGTPGLKTLFDEVPEGTVPLVVPIVVENPSVLFPRLKSLGVPIWRFGEYLHPQINDHLCKNSIYLSQHVFQFPCHSGLTEKEIDWMTEIIKANVC